MAINPVDHFSRLVGGLPPCATAVIDEDSLPYSKAQLVLELTRAAASIRSRAGPRPQGQLGVALNSLESLLVFATNDVHKVAESDKVLHRQLLAMSPPEQLLLFDRAEKDPAAEARLRSIAEFNLRYGGARG